MRAGGGPSAIGPTIECEEQWPFDFAPLEARGKRVASGEKTKSSGERRRRHAELLLFVVAGLQTRAFLFSLSSLAFPRSRTGLKTGHYKESHAGCATQFKRVAHPCGFALCKGGAAFRSPVLRSGFCFMTNVDTMFLHGGGDRL
jgi:hypothetical protein